MLPVQAMVGEGGLQTQDKSSQPPPFSACRLVSGSHTHVPLLQTDLEEGSLRGIGKLRPQADQPLEACLWLLVGSAACRTCATYGAVLGPRVLLLEACMCEGQSQRQLPWHTDTGKSEQC